MKLLEVPTSENKKQLTYYPLLWIWLGGLHPKNTTKLTSIYFYINAIYFLVIFILALIKMVISFKVNIYYVVDSLLTMFLYIHIEGKYIVLYFNKSRLSHLLSERSKFWEILEIDDDVHSECRQILKRAKFLIKCYLTYSCFVASNYLIQPFVTGQLPVLLYVPNEGWYYFWFISFFYLTPAIMSGIWGADTIFYSISIPIVPQFKLLAQKLENLNFKNNSNEIEKEFKVLVDYHNFLIDYSKEINKMSSGLFFIQFLVAIAIACTQLFIASQEEFDLLNKIKCLVYFLMQVVETGIYCLTTELISENAANVGHAVYKSDWYNTSNENVKKNVNIIIARAQKFMSFSGCGLVWINMTTFTQIFKTALSFYTYLNTMVYKD